jgi:SAM-dependent methyltransferase
MRFSFALLWLGLLPVAGQNPLPRELRDPSQNLAPFIASPQPIVDRMLDLAAIKPGDTIYDLGCGDGRVLITAAQRYKAKGVGIELSKNLVRTTNEQLSASAWIVWSRSTRAASSIWTCSPRTS